jgi:hypothetical protein
VRVFIHDPSPGAETSSDTVSSDVREDESFRFSPLHDGSYELAGFGLGTARSKSPEYMNYYILSAHQGDRDVLEQNLISSPNGAPVELILSPFGGIVRGRVVDGTQRPVAQAVVALRPQGRLAARPDRSHTYRTERTDQNGVFEFRGMIPGEYTAFAWRPEDFPRDDRLATADPTDRYMSSFQSEIEDGAFRDPEFMRPYEASGLSLRAEKGTQVSVDLQVIDRAPSARN